MRQLPTSQDLAEIGVQLSQEGFGSHEATLTELASLAQEAGASEAIVNLLGDTAAAQNLRARAFFKLAQAWPDLHQTLITKQQAELAERLPQLLEAWVTHQDLKRADAALSELWDSRAKLDQQRLAIAMQ